MGRRVVTETVLPSKGVERVIGRERKSSNVLATRTGSDMDPELIWAEDLFADHKERGFFGSCLFSRSWFCSPCSDKMYEVKG